MRVFGKLLLATVFVASLTVAVILLRSPVQTETYAVLTGVLAVIASVISAYPAIRLLEVQEDANRPFPTVYFDVNSRVGLLLLRIHNIGASIAYDVNIAWELHPRNEEGERVTGLDNISVLVHGHSIAALVGRAGEIFKKYDSTDYTGVLTYKDAKGKKFRHSFRCSADEHRGKMLFNEELPNVLHELKKMPAILTTIAKEMKHMRGSSDQ